MGGSQSYNDHPQTNLCNQLQSQLNNQRQQFKNNPSPIPSSSSSSITSIPSQSASYHDNIPRSTQVNGRFVLTEEDFPDYIDYGSLFDLYKWRSEADPHETYTEEFLDTNLPVLTPNKELLEKGPSNGTIQTTWIGHASVLTQWDGWNVLADPIFSERCSPVQWAGPKRLRPCPIQAEQLPPIDVCVISHDHYDHLDVDSVTSLNRHHQNLIWMVPLGMKQWMINLGVNNVVELDWSEKIVLNDQTSKNRPPITLHCLPCQHWCSRTRSDKNLCLWSSWAATTKTAGFFFGGDTGYCSMFNRIGQAIPNIVLSALPIGAYGSEKEQWFHRFNHMNPNQAVQTHIDLKSKYSIGIHWGTFQLTGEHILEPPKLLLNSLEEKNIDKNNFIVLKHGETKSFPIEK